MTLSLANRPRTTTLSRRSIVRIVVDLLAEELATSRGQSAVALGAGGWNEATRLDAAGLDLDSLERLNASAALNEFFHLHEYGAEDYLLRLNLLGEWYDLVAQSLAATGTHLTFRTSGSTGTPKRCTHAIADLMVEVDAWAAMLAPIAQIISLVPAHHIYGTIFTALLPDRVEAACVAARFAGAAAVAQAAPGTVVIGTPTLWGYVARSLPAFPPGLTAICSTAPLSTQLARQLTGQRLDRLVEIYGSSETGGIAYRLDPASAFALLGHWHHDGGGTLSRATGGGVAAVAMMDDAAWLDERRFVLAGRRDGAVQIGGYNVFTERVRQRLLDHAGVAEATVRLELATGRLKAFVVPTVASGTDGLVDQLDAWCAAGLSDVERPRRIAVGPDLPRTALGKLTDW